MIYQEGDFFLPHKDSEKEDGMFATLIISLPSNHTGGELMVRFEGKEEVIEFAPSASDYKIPYAAFYADCEHEVKPVTSGYRVNLVYNLVQKAGNKIYSPQFSEQIADLTGLIKSMEASFENKPKAILLDHQYTPANFSFPMYLALSAVSFDSTNFICGYLLKNSLHCNKAIGCECTSLIASMA